MCLTYQLLSLTHPVNTQQIDAKYEINDNDTTKCADTVSILLPVTIASTAAVLGDQGLSFWIGWL